MSIVLSLKRYFRERGCIILPIEELKLPEDIIKEVDLAVLDVKNLILVKVIEGILDRNALMNAAMKVAVFREYADKAYLATPVSFRVIIDGKVLADNGLGLLLVDEQGNVKEVLPPKPKSVKGVPSTYIKALNKLEEQIEILRRRINELDNVMERVNRLTREIERLRREVEVIERELRGERRELYEEVIPKKEIEREEEEKRELPSYLRDNPWLEILSRKRE